MDFALLEPRTALARLAWRVFPGFCVLCRQRSRVPIDLCAECLDALPWTRRVCRRCALPLDAAPGDICAACIAAPPLHTRTVAPLRYRAEIVDLVHALKFDGDPVSGRVLATLLAAALRGAYADGGLPDLVVPVPLSARRLLARGQNQAGVLARRVADTFELAVDWDSCRRIRHTPPQTGRSRRERLTNLSRAFVCDADHSGRTIALVDDVMTTGATVRATTRCLLRAGAAEVHVWVAARTDRLSIR
jgi:ComF family protein